MGDQGTERIFVYLEFVSREQGDDANRWLVLKSQVDPCLGMSLTVGTHNCDVGSQLTLSDVDIL
jgi:hypothetical protein